MKACLRVSCCVRKQVHWGSFEGFSPRQTYKCLREEPTHQLLPGKNHSSNPENDLKTACRAHSKTCRIFSWDISLSNAQFCPWTVFPLENSINHTLNQVQPGIIRRNAFTDCEPNKQLLIGNQLNFVRPVAYRTSWWNRCEGSQRESFSCRLGSRFSTWIRGFHWFSLHNCGRVSSCEGCPCQCWQIELGWSYWESERSNQPFVWH